MRIAIYEDYWRDVRVRYSQFLGKHDLQVYLHLNKEETFNRGRDYLVEKGFSKDNIHFGIPDEIPEADLHLCDGLDRHCFQILPRLPKGKSFLLSGDEEIRKTAQLERYPIINSLEELEKLYSGR